MTGTEKPAVSDLDLDLRVRSRLLAAGTIDPLAIEAYLNGLPDLESQAESIPIEQPAIGPSSYTSRDEPDIDDERFP